MLKSGSKDLKHHYERYGLAFGAKKTRNVSSASQRRSMQHEMIRDLQDYSEEILIDVEYA